MFFLNLKKNIKYVFSNTAHSLLSVRCLRSTGLRVRPTPRTRSLLSVGCLRSTGLRVRPTPRTRSLLSVRCLRSTGLRVRPCKTHIHMYTCHNGETAVRILQPNPSTMSSVISDKTVRLQKYRVLYSNICDGLIM